MSWWGTWDKGLSKMASSALKQAQKKIDKVLDIQEGEEDNQTASSARLSLSSSPPAGESPTANFSDDSFFREWLNEGSSTMTPAKVESVPPQSSKKSPKKLLAKKESNNRLSPFHALESLSSHKPTVDSVPFQSDSSGEISALSMNMTVSQVTNVGDWVMDESLLLSTHLAESSMMEEAKALTPPPEIPSSPPTLPDLEPPSASAPVLSLAAPVRAESASPPVPSSTSELPFLPSSEPLEPRLSVRHDLRGSLGVSSSTVSLKSASESEKVDDDDVSGISVSITDRASHLSMSSDCTDLTVRGEDRGTSPSEQLAVSKDSYESMYSGASRSVHSEALVESSECEAEVFKETEEPTEKEEEVEVGEKCEPSVNDLEKPLELVVPDQPVELPAEISPAQQDSSPVVLDELETGTNSDIEVISSCCTSNNGGDHNLASEGHHVIRLASHTRSVSDCSFLSNIVESVNSDEGIPYETLQKRLSEMKEVLEARESKLLQMSKENIDLRETNNILRQQLHQSEAARECEMTDLNVLTVEFTNRIGEAEKRLQSAAREKEQLKKKLQRAEAELTNKTEDQRFERTLAEKEQQIEELLREGEKMAQEQLKTNNIVKKLRTKERDVDATLQTLTAKSEKLEKENEHLKKVIDNRDENEKQHVDAINQLTRAVQKQEKEILTHKRHAEESQEKARSLQINLESAYKELAELHKTNAAAASEAAHLTLSAEVAAKEHAKAVVAQVEATWTDEKRLLQSELDELRFSLSSQEREAARREEQLRSEIEYLHQKLSQAEQRNEELTTGVSTATRPVLRQLEALQASYNTHMQSWEQAEKQLNERLIEAQRSLAAANEQERCWRERVTELEGQAAGATTQATALRQEKGRLTANLQAEKSRADVLEEEKHKLMVQQQNVRGEWHTARDELRKELLLMENALELARSQLEVERRKSQQLSEQLATAERRAALVSEESSKQRRNSATSLESGEGSQRVFLRPVQGANASLYSLLRDNNASGGAALLEHLQANLQQKDGDITQLQREMEQLDKTREALMVDMVTSNQRVEELVEQVARLEASLSDHEVLNERYNALLQMFGEKMEENEELRLDLQDVKEMYKAQIDLLTRK